MYTTAFISVLSLITLSFNGLIYSLFLKETYYIVWYMWYFLHSCVHKLLNSVECVSICYSVFLFNIAKHRLFKSVDIKKGEIGKFMKDNLTRK